MQIHEKAAGFILLDVLWATVLAGLLAVLGLETWAVTAKMLERYQRLQAAARLAREAVWNVEDGLPVPAEREGLTLQVTQRAMAGFDQPQVLYQIDVLEQDGRRYFTYYAFAQEKRAVSFWKAILPWDFMALITAGILQFMAGWCACLSLNTVSGNWNMSGRTWKHEWVAIWSLLWTGWKSTLP